MDAREAEVMEFFSDISQELFGRRYPETEEFLKKMGEAVVVGGVRDSVGSVEIDPGFFHEHYKQSAVLEKVSCVGQKDKELWG